MVHALLQPKGAGLKLWKRLLLMLRLLLLRKQPRRDSGAMAWANVLRGSVIQRELSKLHDWIVEELRVGLRVEQRRGLCILKAVLLNQVRRRMGRGDVGVGLARSSPVPSEVGHVAPLAARRLPVSRARI